MHTANEAFKKLATCGIQYNKFKDLFNALQEDISELEKKRFTIERIKINKESDTVTRIQLFHLDLKVVFSVVLKDGAPKGKMSLHRCNPYDEKDVIEVTHVLFDRNGDVDIDPPEGEDPLNIYGNGMVIILNWLCDELEGKSKE